MKGKTELDRVIFLISWWLAAIKSHNAIGFFDINKVAEGVALKLLNEIYDYQLENLNYEKHNYPGIDLGDKGNKIGFQITSRRDARKIRESLEKFTDGPNATYSNGIRFLILSQEKKPQLKKEKYQKICPNFEPEKHILNTDDFIGEIHKIYDSKREKFHHIKALLELEIAEKAMKHENLSLVRSKLLEGSQKHYDALTGPNGRFKHLDISNTILSHPKNEWINQQVIIDGKEKSPQNVMEALPLLWKKNCRHSVILGEGGMGKTVSIIRLWEDYLKKCDENIPIPIFIALNEYNQPRPAASFILDTTYKSVLDSSVTVDELWDLLKTPPAELPFVVLLLDGFNEITGDKQQLLLEIQQLLEQAPGVQMIFTSRFDMRFHHGWQDFNLLQLQKLRDDQISDYLQPRSITHPEGRLKQLVSNPMMLTLYAASCEVVKIHQQSIYCDFKKIVETPGELLWNFVEAQVARLPERLAKEKTKITLYSFLLKFLLPAIGFEMERNGLFYFSLEQLNRYMDDYCLRFGLDVYFATFPHYEVLEENAWLGRCETKQSKRKRLRKIRGILTEELLMLVVENEEYRFLHHDFRDYFAAVHVWNELQMGLKQQFVPKQLSEEALSFFVRRFLGEIDEQNRLRPYVVEGKGWCFDKEKERNTLLYKILDLCRGDFSGDVGYAIWNILEIWKEVRGELSGADLSRLDLSKVNLNGVVCSRLYEKTYVSANFNDSLLHAVNLFPQGHSNWVNSAVYRCDGKKILSASQDRTIKEWDTTTGQCIRTLREHNSSVNSAVYSSDGTRILSASLDETVKEWDATTGDCIRTLKGHDSSINSAVYSSDEKKILSALEDKTVTVWDDEKDEYIITLRGHNDQITSAVYSSDGKKILSASQDYTIKEWDATTEECIRTLRGHNSSVNSAVYSSDGEKILSASQDNTIKEWEATTEKCIRTLRGHNSPVNSAVYSSDGKKFFLLHRITPSKSGTLQQETALGH